LADPRLASETEADGGSTEASASDAAFPLSVRIGILLALVVLAVHTLFVSRSLSDVGVFGGVLTLLLPLAIGCGLTLILLIQTRKAQAASRAYAESERRFRMAVEGARCGIWEWDLQADEVFLSDMTGVMLGWGGGGVTSGAEVLSRIAPEHRDRVRQALASAGEFGAFDVSFRVPNRPNGSGPGALSLDRRPRPGARPPAGPGRALQPRDRRRGRRHGRARGPGARPGR
jgi:two-component system cell cycle sensor histidine kinase PleC